MIIFHHHNLERDQALLWDQQWKRTNYYELSCRSELWGSAFMVTLHKTITASPDEAMIYLLERLAVEGEGWSEVSLSDMHIIDFGNFIRSSGYLAQDEGRRTTPIRFLENFNEIKAGIFEEEGSSLRKNAQAIHKELPLTKEELVAAFCFADAWNNRQYFAESREEWLLFSWATSV